MILSQEEISSLKKIAKSMKCGEKYRLVFLEEDLSSSGIGASDIQKMLERFAGTVVTLRQLAGNGRQWSTEEVFLPEYRPEHHWFFNADCFMPLDTL